MVQAPTPLSRSAGAREATTAGHGKGACTAGPMCLIGDGGLPVDEDQAAGYFARADEPGFDSALDRMGLSG